MWRVPSTIPNAQQWAYQGTAKVPYIITTYAFKRDGSTTADGWACSCMNFTRNMPRCACKHILNIMLNEGLKPVNISDKNVAAKSVTNLTDSDLDAFKKWQREQAEKGNITPEARESDLTLFGATGRKFRVTE